MKNTRPYMTIFTRYVPRKGVNTSVANWAQGGNLTTVERFEIVDRLTNRHKREASFVFDIAKMEVVKNSTGVDAEVMLNHYAKKYEQDIAVGLSVWLEREEAVSE